MRGRRCCGYFGRCEVGRLSDRPEGEGCQWRHFGSSAPVSAEGSAMACGAEPQVDVDVIVARASPDTRRCDASRREVDLRGKSFFERVPQVDLYCLRTILHHRRDPACQTILRQYQSASQAGARLVVIERLPGESTPSAPIARLDRTRMVQLGGRERTQKEYDHLLRGAKPRICPFP